MLAEWLLTRLVNRADVWGAHGREGDRWTAPAIVKRGQVNLTLATIRRHVQGRRPSDVIGLHAISAHDTCRWCALDIDAHEGGTDPYAAFRAALQWHYDTEQLGLTPILERSGGGFHLWLIWREPVESKTAYLFTRWLTRRWANRLPAPPECFPKQRSLHEGCRYGNWLRLPGLHPKRGTWSAIWDGQRWAEWADAVQMLPQVEGDDPGLIPATALNGAQFSSLTNRVRVDPHQPTPTHTEIQRRAAAYMAKLPHRGEGQGRDNVAFGAAAFLIFDLGLSEVDALPWLSWWDARNHPPKGDDRLRVILGNARRYGHGGAR